MVPSSAAGHSTKGNALLLAIIDMELVEDALGAALTLKAPLDTGAKAWAPAQHIASTAADFMIAIYYRCITAGLSSRLISSRS